MTTPKRKRGRPPLPPDASTARGSLTVRVSAEERARWERAAADERRRTGEMLTLGEWVRRRCEEAAGA